MAAKTTTKKKTISEISASSESIESIWECLSQIDLRKVIKSNPKGLSYLSWPHAWEVMMDHYPYMKVEYTTFNRPARSRESSDKDGGFTKTQIDAGESHVCYHLDMSGSVECTVTIGECSMTEFLPIMTGFSNKSPTNPDARMIGDAKKRCFVKCCALFGLGLYIYQGEDIPTEDEKPKEVAPPKPVRTAPPKPAPVVEVEPPNTSSREVEAAEAEQIDSTGEESFDNFLQYKGNDRQVQREVLAGVVIVFEELAKDCNTPEQVDFFWKHNKDTLRKLKDEYEETFVEVRKMVTKRKKQLKEGK